MTSPPHEPKSSDQEERDRAVENDEARSHFTMPMEVFRDLYKTEIHVLWQGVEQFRELCQREMAKQRALLKESHIQCKEAFNEQSDQHSAPDLPSDISRELRKLEQNMTFLEDRDSTSYKDRCRDFLENGRTESLESSSSYVTPPTYEERRLTSKDNGMTTKRGSPLRSRDLETSNPTDQDSQASSEETLNAELRRSLGHIESIDSDKSNATVHEPLSEVTTQSTDTTSKARKHWMTARKHLIDKMALLEATVKRYRTELASATMKITAKEMEMSQLNNQLTDLRNEVVRKDRKIEELEDRLMKSLVDKSRSEKNLEMFMEELQNIELHSTTIEVAEQQEEHHPPPKQQTSLKQRLLRKQLSSMSFFGPSIDREKPRSNFDSNTTSGESGESTPEHESPGIKRRLSHPPVKEDLNSNGASDLTTRRMLNEFLGKGRSNNKDDQTEIKKHNGVDTSSRACVVM